MGDWDRHILLDRAERGEPLFITEGESCGPLEAGSYLARTLFCGRRVKHRKSRLRHDEATQHHDANHGEEDLGGYSG